MPKICYIPRQLSPASRQMVSRANVIIEDYQAQGLALTLRQLYYQFVSRGMIENKQNEYKRLGSVINDARLAGLIDWEAIEDRTRDLRRNAHWSNPGGIIESAADSYALDKWAGQPRRVEVWVEKDALIGVLEQVCRPLDVAFFSCRGYTSQSEMWVASQRLLQYAEAGQRPVIIHLGDHDPSGMDMSRDIQDRLITFMEHHGVQAVKVERVALNMDQVHQHRPPPNPAKITDSRAREYIALFGPESWELDALDPATLRSVIESAVAKYMDRPAFERIKRRQEGERGLLRKAADNWTDVAQFLGAQE